MRGEHEHGDHKKTCLLRSSSSRTTGQNEVWRGQHDIRKRLQQTEVNQVGEETHSDHERGEALKQIEPHQHRCGELREESTS